MAIDYSLLPLSKPEPRKRTKARKVRVSRAAVRDVRAYVFARERDICRCCRCRPATSMHELQFRSCGGRVSKRNSVAACGDGVSGCHGFAQRHEIAWDDYDRRGAGGHADVSARSSYRRQSGCGRVGDQEIVSPPMVEMETAE
jgi:hypothetical protein